MPGLKRPANDNQGQEHNKHRSANGPESPCLDTSIRDFYHCREPAMTTLGTNRNGRITKRDLLAALPDVNSTLVHCRAPRSCEDFSGRLGCAPRTGGIRMGRVHGPGIRHRTRPAVAHGVRPPAFVGQMGGVGRPERDCARPAVAQARHRTRRQGRSTSGRKTSAADMLEAYCAGVNAFIETTDSLPIEYRILDANRRNRGRHGIAWPRTRCGTSYTASGR